MAKKENIINKPTGFCFSSFERGVTSAPKFLENWDNNGKPYIFCGRDNLYPQEIIRLYRNASGLHSQLIRKKSDMTAGEGFVKDGLDNATKLWLSNPFSEDSLDRVAYKSATDLWLQGGFYLAVTWNKTFDKIARIQHIPYEKVRIEKPKDGGEPLFYVSRDFEYVHKKENKCVIFHPFNQETAEQYPTQILFTRQYCPGSDYYPTPSYSESLTWIKIAYEIAVFHLKSIQNNLNAGMIVVNKSGIPTQEERDLDSIRFKQRQTGADVAGDVLFVYAENSDKAPDFIPMPNNGSDERFQHLMEQVNQNIMVAHGATSQVSGLETAGKLGSREEITDGYLMFQKAIISPAQKIIEDTINKLGALGGYSELKLAEYNIFPEESTQYDSSIAASIAALGNNKPLVDAIISKLTDDEIRGLVGLPSTNIPLATEPSTDTNKPA